jgi:hypothetical protein
MSATKKVSELTALTTPKAGDLLLIVDSPASADPSSKKITVENLFKNVNASNVFSQNVSAVNVVANNSLVVGGASVNTQISSTQLRVGNSTVNSILTAQTLNIGTTVAINSVAIAISNNGTATYISAAQATFGANVEITGQLIVSGIATYLNTDELNISDPQIVLNSELPPNFQATVNAGITINRGNAANVNLIWNETTDKWQISDANGTFANVAIEFYTPTVPSDWNATPPTTTAEAIDRLAALVKILNSGTGA